MALLEYKKDINKQEDNSKPSLIIGLDDAMIARLHGKQEIQAWSSDSGFFY